MTASHYSFPLNKKKQLKIRILDPLNINLMESILGKMKKRKQNTKNSKIRPFEHKFGGKHLGMTGNKLQLCVCLD